VTVKVSVTIDPDDGSNLTDGQIADAYDDAVGILNHPDNRDRILLQIAEALRKPPVKPRRQCARKRIPR
jgi:hypothetical protein